MWHGDVWKTCNSVDLNQSFEPGKEGRVRNPPTLLCSRVQLPAENHSSHVTQLRLMDGPRLPMAWLDTDPPHSCSLAHK